MSALPGRPEEEPDTRPYDVLVTQERTKSLRVEAEDADDAAAKVRAMLPGDYGGWQYRSPRLVAEPAGGDL